MSLLRALRAYVGLGPDEDYEDRYLYDLSDRRASDDEHDLEETDDPDDFDELEEAVGRQPRSNRGGGDHRRPRGAVAELRPVVDEIDLRDVDDDPAPTRDLADRLRRFEDLDELDDDAFIERLLAEDDDDGSETVVIDEAGKARRPDPGRHRRANPAPSRSGTKPAAPKDDAPSGDTDDVFAEGVRARPRSTNHAQRKAEDRAPSPPGGAVVHSLDSMRAKPRTIAPETFADAKLVADEFKREIPVLLNLQALDRELARRLIDFASGLCYGLDGSMEKIASQAFLLVPESVEVSDEDRRRIEERGYAR